MGVLQQMPMPMLGDDDAQRLAALAREAHDRKREADRDDEVTHPFTAPALLRRTLASAAAPVAIVGPPPTYPSLAAAHAALLAEDAARDQRLASIQREIDDICFRLYGFSDEDRAEIEGAPSPSAMPAAIAAIAANINGSRAQADGAAADAMNAASVTDLGNTPDTPDTALDTPDAPLDAADALGDAATPAQAGQRGGQASDADDDDAADAADERPAGKQRALRDEIGDWLMYTVGCAFGRWDARIGRDATLAPALADPFAPLPVCAPGALVGPAGLPARKDAIALLSPDRAGGLRGGTPHGARSRAHPYDDNDDNDDAPAPTPTITADEYPLPIAWDGILVDDPDAENDIVRRVRAALDALYGADGRVAGALEAEACALLGVRDLREFFRNPRLFFEYHISRYSKSRRKAPIYWLLQSARRSYSIWLYYHRLDADLIFKAINFHLLPRLRLEEQRQEQLTTAKQQAGASGPEARRLAQALDHQHTLLGELRDFRDALDRAARLYLTPDLNDGVLLNIAPYHEVVSWKSAKATWDQLLAGKYEWSSIGQQLRAKGVVTWPQAGRR